MRVAVVTTSFPRCPGDPSGHFVLSHVRALAKAGADVHVIAPGPGVGAPEQRDAFTLHLAGGGELFGWPGAAARARERPWRLVGAPVFVATARARLARLGALEKIVAHWLVPSAFPIAGAARGELEVFAHGADVRLLVASPACLRARVVRSVVERGGRVAFVASALRDALVAASPGELGRALEAASRVEPTPIDVPDVEAESTRVRRELGARFAGDGGGEPPTRVIACAGRLVATKRFELAVDAVAAIEGAALVVVGDGPARAAIEARASTAGARVVFTGLLPREAALAHVAAADALVHPSAVEAAPTIVREARALGVPVVACAAGDVVAWARSDAGIVVAEPSVEALASALERAARRRP